MTIELVKPKLELSASAASLLSGLIAAAGMMVEWAELRSLGLATLRNAKVEAAAASG